MKKAVFVGATLLATLFSTAAKALAIPSYARQTNLSCNICHITFPRLNAFGRLFKLNGYTMTGIRSIVSTGNDNPSLKLTSFMPISAMAQTSVAFIRRAEPGTRRYAFEFPQQLSFFIAGEITPHLGTFVQITYEAIDPKFEWDNTDIRLAFPKMIGSKRAIFGLTLNNGPTVQDVWNSTPVWGFPFSSSFSAPAPQTSTLIEGQLNGQVAGLGGYVFYNNLAYAEFSLYTSTPQGGPFPASPASVGTLRGASPYWRFVLQHAWGATQYLSVGTYGLSSRLYPVGITGPTNEYTDVALDAQYERTIGEGALEICGTWIHESRNLRASFLTGDAAFQANTVRTLKASASFNFRHTYSLTAGYFDVGGGSDFLLYAPEPVDGSRLNKPNSSGIILEAQLYAWQNSVITLQYTLYSRFNGGGANYDGFGRDASANNTLYLALWMAF